MKCLIVEDNLVVRLDYIDFMQDLGYACFEADSVQDACYLLKTHDFDVVLLDLEVRDGLTFPIVDFIEMRSAAPVVILITGTGAFPYGETVTLSPRIDYLLRKPVNLDDLSALVSYRLASKST